MFKSIAKFSVRFRWLIIIFWIALVPILTSTLPNISSVTKDSTQDFLPKNSPTSTAFQLEQSFQRKDTATNSAIAVSRSDGKLTPEDNLALQRMVDRVKEATDVTEVRDLGPSADGKAHEYLVGISGAAFGNDAAGIVKNIRDAIRGSNLPGGLSAYLTGDLAASVDQENANNSGR